MKSKKGSWFSRVVYGIFFISLVALTYVVCEIYFISLHPVKIYTGWALFAAILFLALYNWRKKVPFLANLGTSAFWMKGHIFLGFFSLFLFFFHLGFAFPYGLEFVLVLLFALVFASGILGLWITRSYPAKMASRMKAGEVIYERIPTLSREVQREVEKLLLQAAEENESGLLTEFYKEELAEFFSRPRNFFSHLRHSMGPRNILLEKIEDLKSSLGKREREIAEEISQKIMIKHDLDYHYSLQSALKYWLFCHIPFTYSLLILAVVHGLAAHAFSGGSL